ncbi:MAG: 2-C-methyl-D-erythritol 2,4-cyclodiphosphate synthase, partial [Alphaproteobacteria bacterium]|nr:2-C-methyl-D-erythritol 2,4-cyclodiphosphate synthase [Alphaproteobacteria bacterium]
YHMTETRTGTGFDVHAFIDEAGPIWVAGIELNSPRRITAHSDGDVALHALCDAIFGALADGDIGTHFPPSDSQWKNADSSQFLRYAVARVMARGGRIINLDLTVICETPKIGPHRDAMRRRIAEICDIDQSRITDTGHGLPHQQVGFLNGGLLVQQLLEGLH